MPQKDWQKVEKIKAHPGKLLEFDFTKKPTKCFLCSCCLEWKPVGWYGNTHHCRSCGNVICTECSKQKATKKDIFYELNDVPFTHKSRPDSKVRICNSCAKTYECKVCGITEQYYKVSDKINGVHCTKCHNQLHERRNKRLFNIAQGVTLLLNQPSGSVMLLGHTHSKEDCMGDGFLLDYLKMLKRANLKLFNVMASRMLVINEGPFPGYKRETGCPFLLCEYNEANISRQVL